MSNTFFRYVLLFSIQFSESNFEIWTLKKVQEQTRQISYSTGTILGLFIKTMVAFMNEN
jgi:hypothetical protein